ncbi:DUF2913 family protein [Vibrio hepatarius]|uniref:DUF2913 family protein n=1 Tax=Vibrio hepatarius TaxID=171383 RepID=UPI00142D8F04|nr:DUF2913 family protein [Vibrio hepatarius]NIY85222.1 DUF2913 family protein [Vibrio hepatarius]
MQIKKDFDYYYNLHDTVTHALLHLLFKVSMSERFVPTAKRNEVLVKYLKPKLNDKSLSNIRKDIKLMLNVARKKTGNLEMRLYQLNEQANRTQMAGVEKLYSLLMYLHEEEGLESQLYEEGVKAEPDVLYLLEGHIEHGFDQNNKQTAPVSILTESERAPDLLDVIHRFGWFVAEMKEWNPDKHQAHILLHPPY